MDTLVLNGKSYVRASKAARNLGYTSDYVGQLCRSGQVDAHLVGRTWYVHEDELSTHRVEKKRMARVKAREQAHKTLEEYRLKTIPETQNNYKKVAIRYESDHEELIPRVEKKIRVVPETTPERIGDSITPDTPGFEIENEGKKVIMSGTLEVRDAEYEEEYGGFTVLTPKVIKKRKRTDDQTDRGADDSSRARVLSVDSEDEESVILLEEDPAEHQGHENDEVERISFEERLEMLSEEAQEVPRNEELANIPVTDKEGKQEQSGAAGRGERPDFMLYIVFLIFVLCVSILSIFAEAFVVARTSIENTTYQFDFSGTYADLRSKI